MEMEIISVISGESSWHFPLLLSFPWDVSESSGCTKTQVYAISIRLIVIVDWVMVLFVVIMLKTFRRKPVPCFHFIPLLIEFLSWSTQQRETTCVCLVHYFSLSGHLIVHYHTYLRTFQNMGTWSFVLLSVRYTSLANLGYYFLQNMQPFRCSQCSLDEPGCFWLKK